MLTVRGLETRLCRLEAKRRPEGEVFFLAWDRNDKKAFQRASLARASADQNLRWSCPLRNTPARRIAKLQKFLVAARLHRQASLPEKDEANRA